MSDVDTKANVSDAQVPGSQPAASNAESAPANQGANPADTSKEVPADAPKSDEDAERFQKSSDYKRISRQRANAERRAMRAEAERDDLRAQLQRAAPQQQRGAEPKQSDFANYDEYQRALAEHVARRVAEETVSRATKEQSQRAAAEAAGQTRVSFEKEAAQQAKAAGYDFADEWETLLELPAQDVSTAFAEYLYQAAENKAALVHYFAENTDEVARISDMHPAATFKEMAKLDLRLGTRPSRPATNAPPPPNTVGGRAVTEFNPQKADMESYADHWKAQRAKKRA